MAGYPPPPPSPSPSIDPRRGFCQETKIFHSLRPAIPLPPVTVPLSVASYAFSLLPSPLPSHPAFLDAATGSAVSFPDLLSQSRSLAVSLRARLGLSPGHVALILSPARLEIPVLYFALLSLGVAISPANPASTPAEIARLCRLSNPSVAFAVSDTAAALPGHLPTLLLDSPEFKSLLTAVPSAAAPADVQQSDTAAILYSSGTTGQVKGVELTHRNVTAVLASFVMALGCRMSPAVQMVTVPLFHVYGFIFCIKAVAVGETAVIQTERFDIKKTLRAIDRFGVTHLTMAPPALRAMVRACEDGWPSDLSSLEAISCGGAPVGMDLIKRFVQRFPNVRLSQGYGLTESSSGVFRPINMEESLRLGSAGRLVSGCEAKIIDPVTGEALPPGMPGELWLRGATIMKGYIGDQDATSQILNSEGWLKTGDLCYIDDDGFLFVVDRLKELIKYKGYQVSPAELEHLLQTHPNIIEAAVVACPNEEAGELPVACVVRQLDSTVSESQLMEFVAQQVAPYKRIRHVLFVDSIPKNAAENEDDGDTFQVVPDIGPTVKSTATSQMEAAIASLARELSKLRTGRASAGMLDHIIVETGGAKIPLNHVAVVSVIDVQTLSVTPYDPNALKAVEHAILASPLGINPTPDGQRIIAAIPRLTKENIQALCKVVAKSAEDVKQSIRRARQKALDSIKKAASNIPKDDAKRLEKEVEEMTKRFVKSADDMCKAKEKEITGN